MLVIKVNLPANASGCERMQNFWNVEGHPFCSQQEVLQDSRTASKLTKIKQTSKLCMQWPSGFPPRLLEIGTSNSYAVAMVTLLGSEAPSAPKNSVASSPSTSPSSK